MSKKFFTLPNIIFAVIILSLSLGVFLTFADWSAPPTTPPICPVSEPGCNLPLNVSGVGQIKAGGLTLGANLGPSDTGLIVLNGNVGIGTSTPSQKLDVSGQIHATGDICTDTGGRRICLSQLADLIPRTTKVITVSNPDGAGGPYLSGNIACSKKGYSGCKMVLRAEVASHSSGWDTFNVPCDYVFGDGRHARPVLEVECYE